MCIFAIAIAYALLHTLSIERRDDMPVTHRPAAPTERNKRLNKLGGCTPLGRDLADARIAVNLAIRDHRTAQDMAAKPYSTFYRSPASTRLSVRQAVARVRDAERRIEAKYGPAVVAPAPAFLMAAE